MRERQQDRYNTQTIAAAQAKSPRRIQAAGADRKPWYGVATPIAAKAMAWYIAGQTVVDTWGEWEATDRQREVGDGCEGRPASGL